MSVAPDLRAASGQECYYSLHLQCIAQFLACWKCAMNVSERNGVLSREIKRVGGGPRQSSGMLVDSDSSVCALALLSCSATMEDKDNSDWSTRLGSLYKIFAYVLSLIHPDRYTPVMKYLQFRQLLNTLNYIGFISVIGHIVFLLWLYTGNWRLIFITFGSRLCRIANSNNHWHLLRPYCMPGALLNTFHILTYFLDTINLYAIKHDSELIPLSCMTAKGNFTIFYKHTDSNEPGSVRDRHGTIMIRWEYLSNRHHDFGLMT